MVAKLQNFWIKSWAYQKQVSLQERHDGPVIAHLRVNALMPHFLLQLKLTMIYWTNLVEDKKRNILVKLIS